jgi:hypothetical protein
LRQALAAGEPGPTLAPVQPTLPAAPSQTWQAPPVSPPPPSATWQAPPVSPPGPPPYSGVAPVAAPGTGSILPWLLLGGGVVVLLLLAGLAGLFLISRDRLQTSTPSAPVFATVPRPTPPLRPTDTTEAAGPPRFEKITFAQGYSKEKLEPIGPASSFAAGVTEVHAIFEYSSMSNDYTWERVLYRDGNEMLRKSERWNSGKKGIFDYFISAQGEPLASGDWRLELYVEGQLLSQGNFTVE